MAISQKSPDEDLLEDDAPIEEVECITIEGFEVVKRGSILQVKRKREGQEEE